MQTLEIKTNFVEHNDVFQDIHIFVDDTRLFESMNKLLFTPAFVLIYNEISLKWTIYLPYKVILEY